ncbi:MAG: amidohydrolase [Aquificae bacterium]|nr:amidohydrolase [Aquificota bacterium]
MERVDLIISNGWIITNTPKGQFVGDIAIKGGKIAEVGSNLREKYQADKVIDATGKIVAPAFANMHTHAAMNLFRGIGADLPLMDWLTKVIWPLEGEFVSPEFVKDGVSLALLEMIKSGTTFYLDMYFFEEYTAEVIKEAGIRAGLGFGILDFPTKVASSPDEYLQRVEEFIKTFKRDKDILPVVAPHAVYTCSPETLKKAFDLAEKYDVPYHIHLAESQGELAQVKEKYGTTPVRHMKNLGLLSERVIAAHMVWLDEEEQEAVAQSGTKVAHCPESNLKLGSGIAPVSDYIKKGIKVCLGTDGAASNDNLNMLEEMSTMAKLQKGIKLDPTALSSAQALEIATANGFESVGIKAGRIKEGYDADLIIVDANKPHLQPLYDPTAQLVYSAQAGDIETVIARGKILMENYKVLTLDEEEIYKKALYWKEKILNKLNG